MFTASRPRPLTRSQAKYSQLDFRLALIDQLIAGFSSRKRSGRKSAEAPTFDECNLTGHKLTKMSKKLVCVTAFAPHSSAVCAKCLCARMGAWWETTHNILYRYCTYRYICVLRVSCKPFLAGHCTVYVTKINKDIYNVHRPTCILDVIHELN